MKDIREILNISYFDNKELNLKEHCNIYSNIKKDLISILNKYDIKYVVADTELIRDLSKENKELKKQLEELELIVTLSKKRNLISKFNKEYDEEDKKKNPDRDYAEIMPDSEEIYKRYYAMKTQQKEFIEYLKEKIEKTKNYWGNCIYYGNDKGMFEIQVEINLLEEVLSKYKKIIGAEK